MSDKTAGYQSLLAKSQQASQLEQLIVGLHGDVKALAEGRANYETQVADLVAKNATLETQNKALDERLKELTQKFEEAMRQRTVGLAGLADEKAKRTFSFARALNGICFGEWGDGYEREIMREYGKVRAKALGTDTDTAGGFVVPPEHMTDIIELLEARSVVKQAGATVLAGLKGAPVEIPRIDGGATAFWVGENLPITASQQLFGQVTLTPHMLAAMTQVSQRMVRMGVPSVEALIKKDIATKLALKLDLAALRGDGTLGSPLGVRFSPGVTLQTIGPDANNGDELEYNDAHELIGALEDANAMLDGGKFAFIAHPKVIRTLKKQVVQQFSGAAATQGQPIFAPIMSNEALSEATGYNWFGTTQLPINLTKGTDVNLSEVYFGNWAELMIGEWGGLDIQSSNQAGTSFENHQVWIKMVMDTDVALRHGASFAVVTDAEIVGFAQT